VGGAEGRADFTGDSSYGGIMFVTREEIRQNNAELAAKAQKAASDL
jgi:hypothetical protein